MAAAKSEAFAVSRPAFIVLGAVALLAIAGCVYLFVDHRSEAQAWEAERARLTKSLAEIEGERTGFSEEIAALNAEIAQLKSATGGADQAHDRLDALTEEIRRREQELSNLGQRIVTSQAGLERNIRKRKELEEKSLSLKEEMARMRSDLQPLRDEMTTRSQEIKDLEAVLREAKDRLDKALGHLEGLATLTPG
jgi:chromosome segregation ATPase